MITLFGCTQLNLKKHKEMLKMFLKLFHLQWEILKNELKSVENSGLKKHLNLKCKDQNLLVEL